MVVLLLTKITKSPHPQKWPVFADICPVLPPVSAFGAIFADTCPVSPPVSAFGADFTDTHTDIAFVSVEKG